MFSFLPKRYILALMALLGFANVYALRVNLSVAIVTMMGDNNKINSYFKDWTSETRGLVLASFFYGYIFTQVPGGLLAERFGGKWVFGLGCLGTTLLTLVTPIAAYHSLGLLLAVRILEGIGEGVTFPAVHAMWAKWAPPLEKSKLTTISYAGSHIGTIIGLSVSGVLCDHGFESPPHYERWPSVFYVFGALGLIWCIAWFFIAHSSPASHPTISSDERFYIESKIAEATPTHRNENIPASWLAARFFLSPAVWSVTISHMCNNWGFYTVLTSLPTFFSDVLNFDIQDNGFLSAVPFGVMAITIISGGFLADFLRSREILTTTKTRKLLNSLGQLCPAIFLVVIGYTSSKVLAVLFLVIAVGLSGFSMAGFNINHLDIAPRFAGVLMGISNTAATVSGIVAPYVTGAMTTDDKFNWKLKGQWQNVFYLSAEIYAFGGIMYLILGSGKLQWWAEGPRQTQSMEYDGRVQTPDKLEGGALYGSM